VRRFERQPLPVRRIVRDNQLFGFSRVRKLNANARFVNHLLRTEYRVELGIDVGAALDAYRVDNGSYPTSTDSVRTAKDTIGIAQPWNVGNWPNVLIHPFPLYTDQSDTSLWIPGHDNVPVRCNIGIAHRRAQSRIQTSSHVLHQ
jgi:hypothetical protein